MSMRLGKRSHILVSCLAAFGITAAALLLLYVVGGYAPFGGNSLAYMDGDIQYLDFFAYLQNILAGEDGFGYTMGKALGGNGMAVLSYYLLSPLNVLVLLFRQEQLHVFFDLLVVLKLALASTACCYFIHRRFSGAVGAGMGNQVLVVLLSVGYGLCHYTLTQASNIMWLDAAYCLPLMLLGTYRVVRGERGMSLAVWTAFAIWCNWYAGAINCLFACIWWVWETVLLYLEEQPKKSWKEVARRTVWSGGRYAFLMGVGVLLVCVVFLPTVKALQNGLRGDLELERLLDLKFVGQLPSVFQNNVIGFTSDLGQPSLFCGSLALLGCVGCVTYRKIAWQQRVAYGLMLLVVAMLLLWNPLCYVFSLLKTANSYWYRYSYVCIFLVVFLAARFFFCHRREDAGAFLAKAGLGLAGALVVLFYLREGQNLKYTYLTAMVLCVGAVAVGVWHAAKNRNMRAVALVLAVLVFGAELGYNARVQMNQYHVSNVKEYQTYVEEQSQQISQIQQQDDGLYRINQTSTRNMGSNGLTAYYNDALAYGYWSIAGYTSSPDEVPRQLLNRMGYGVNGPTMSIVNTSMVAADALLGVKYVLSPYAIHGLELREDLGTHNGKQVYENPYALPMAFVFEDGGAQPQEDVNPFEYQNQLYSQLLGEDVTLYIPLEYTTQDVAQGQRVYTVQLPEGEYGVYGNLPWKFQQLTQVSVNGSFLTNYSCWLSPSVLYLPTQSGDREVQVEVSSKNMNHMPADTAQFYGLDLKELERVSQKLRQGAVSSCQIENGFARVEVSAQGENQLLQISIPYDKGWRVTRNGEPVEPQLLGNCMYVIPLEQGENVVEMHYQVPGLKVGAALTGLGVVLLAGYWAVSRRKKRG